MATLRSAVAAATSAVAGSLAVTNPSWTGSATPVGDIIKLYCAAPPGTSVTFSCPGFTAETVVTGGSGGYGQLLHRISDGTEGATFTVTVSSPVEFGIGALSYFNENQSIPFDPSPPGSGKVNGSSSTTVTVTGITTLYPGDQLAWFGFTFWTGTAGSVTINVPSGFTARSSQANSVGSGSTENVSIIVADKAITSAGPTGNQNGSLTGGARLNGGLLVGITSPAVLPSGNGYIDQAGPRPRWAALKTQQRSRKIEPPWGQANQGIQFPLITRPPGSRPRWAPYIRRSKLFMPGLGQAGQGVRFPLFTRQPGYRPRWAPYIRRGRQFLPGLGQPNRGIVFPLVLRGQAGPHPRFAPKLRRGAQFLHRLPQFPQGSPWNLTTRPAGYRPRWAPPPRITRSRIFHPPRPQGPLAPAPFPLFTRQKDQRARLSKIIRSSRLFNLPHAARFLSASARFTFSGTMTVTGTTAREAEAFLQASGTLRITPVIVRPGAVSLAARGTMEVLARLIRAATVSMHATASMTTSGVITRKAAVTMSAASAMTVTAADSSGVKMRAAGSMTVASEVMQLARVTMSASSSMITDADATPAPREIVIEPNAIAPWDAVIAGNAYREEGPVPGPADITVPGIIEGDYDTPA